MSLREYSVSVSYRRLPTLTQSLTVLIAVPTSVNPNIFTKRVSAYAVMNNLTHYSVYLITESHDFIRTLDIAVIFKTFVVTRLLDISTIQICCLQNIHLRLTLRLTSIGYHNI